MMIEVNLVFIAVSVMLVCLFLKIPVFAAILAGSVSYFALTPVVSAQIISQRMTAGIESIPLLAVPFFICAGVFMNTSGITRRIFNFCSILVGRMYGGLAQVNILLSTLMGGLSGSSLADAAMEAKMLVPEMEKAGMSKAFSTVITAFSSTIVPLIPPGIGMILYGSIANISIGKLFVSGLAIGVLMCITSMILTSMISRKRGYVPITKEKTKPEDLWKAFKEASLPLILPLIIIGGIRFGVFTATEAGAVAVLYSIILGFIYRELNLKNLIACLKESVLGTAPILLIVGAASAFAWVLTRERVPQTLTDMMVNGISNKYVFLLVVNLFLLVVGMFVEGNAATIVIVPLLVPIARHYGIDDIQFAFVFIYNMAIGALTPPVGTLMFVTCGITECKYKDFLKEAVPYYGIMLVNLLLISYVPIVTLGILDLVW
jgi:tripartite ATP-independent transporter DctM subunit